MLILNNRNILLLLTKIRDTNGTEEETRTSHRPPREGWTTLLLRKLEGIDRPLGQGCHRGLIQLSQEPQHLRGQALSE